MFNMQRGFEQRWPARSRLFLGMYQLSFQTTLWVDQLGFGQITPTQPCPELCGESLVYTYINDAAIPPGAELAGRNAAFHHQRVSAIERWEQMRSHTSPTRKSTGRLPGGIVEALVETGGSHVLGCAALPPLMWPRKPHCSSWGFSFPAFI